MTELTLTATHLLQGVWQGVLSGSKSQPDIGATHLGKPVEGVTVTKGGAKGQWLVHVPVPLDAISDGVQTFLVNDQNTGARLNSFAILAGEPLSDDIRVEIDLLRAELDMLKKAFRRHCVETMQSVTPRI